MREGEDQLAVQGLARARVPPWLRRAIVFLLLGAAALFVAFWLVGRLRSLITMLLVSLFLAFAMEPATNYLAARDWRRGLATAAVFAVLVGVVIVLVTALARSSSTRSASSSTPSPGMRGSSPTFSTSAWVLTWKAASWPISCRATRGSAAL